MSRRVRLLVGGVLAVLTVLAWGAGSVSAHTSGARCDGDTAVYHAELYGAGTWQLDAGPLHPFTGGFTTTVPDATTAHTVTVSADDWDTVHLTAGPCVQTTTTTTEAPPSSTTSPPATTSPSSTTAPSSVPPETPPSTDSSTTSTPTSSAPPSTGVSSTPPTGSTQPCDRIPIQREPAPINTIGCSPCQTSSTGSDSPPSASTDCGTGSPVDSTTTTSSPSGTSGGISNPTVCRMVDGVRTQVTPWQAWTQHLDHLCPLPSTGNTSGSLIAAGLVALLGGVALVVVARRRAS